MWTMWIIRCISGIWLKFNLFSCGRFGGVFVEKNVDSVDNWKIERIFCAGCLGYHNFSFMSAANRVEYCRDGGES